MSLQEKRGARLLCVMERALRAGAAAGLMLVLGGKASGCWQVAQKDVEDWMSSVRDVERPERCAVGGEGERMGIRRRMVSEDRNSEEWKQEMTDGREVIKKVSLSLSLLLRIPDAPSEHGKFFLVRNVK